MVLNDSGLAKSNRYGFPERLTSFREPVVAPKLIRWLPVLAAIAGTIAMLWCWSSLSATLRSSGSASRGADPSLPSAGSHVQSPLAPVFTPQVQRWSADIRRWAASAGLDPNFVATVMQIESCGDPTAVSGAGAIGLFQVMPYHFQPGENPYDPDTNARVGLAYLAAGLRQAQGQAAPALAGYNGGHALISLPASSWPDQTARYVVWGSGLLKDIADQRVPSPTLARWLSSGGSALCQQADRTPHP
jgi:hypothetical protein